MLPKKIVPFFGKPYSVINRCVFRTLYNIYEGDFLQKYLKTKRRWLFLQKNSIINALEGPKHSFDHYETDWFLLLVTCKRSVPFPKYNRKKNLESYLANKKNCTLTNYTLKQDIEFIRKY